MAKAPTNRSTAAELADLRQAIERLADAVAVLIQVVDQLTDEVQWRNNQLRDLSLPPLVLTSMPKDPTARDWQINRVSPDDLPDDLKAPTEAGSCRPGDQTPVIHPVRLTRKEAAMRDGQTAARAAAAN